jgi:hypothetical protein
LDKIEIKAIFEKLLLLTCLFKSFFFREGLMIAKADRRVDFEFHPRFETLEGRSLPSVSHLPLITPVLNGNTQEIIVVVETTSNYPFAHRVDFVYPLVIVQSSPSARSAIQQEISVPSPTLTTTQTPVSPINNGLTQEANANASSLPASVPEEAANTGAIASLSSFTNAPSSPRPVVAKPSLPDNQPTQPTRLILLTESPTFIETFAPVLFGNSKLLPPEIRVGQTTPQPVQAITNRLEFIGGGLSVPENALPTENDPEAGMPPQAPPAAPPPDLPELLPLGGMLTHPLSQNELVNEPWISDAMVLGTLVGQEGEGQTVLTPELVGEMATLAAGLGGFAKVNPPEVAARRGSKILGEFEIELKNGRKK